MISFYMSNVFPLQVPMNLNSHRESVVLSLTLPFRQRSAPNELMKAQITTNMVRLHCALKGGASF